MNFEQLRTFYKIGQTGSFTKASRSLFISQSAVSQQIQNLEYSLGFKLFNRSIKKAFLTPEGENLFIYAKRLFDLYDEVISLSHSQKAVKIGKLAFASTRVLGMYYLPKIIGLYIRQYPGVEVYFRMGNSHCVIDLLLEGNVEFGICGSVPHNPRLSNVFIHREKLVAVSAPSHYIAQKQNCTVYDISKVPLIWREIGTQTRKSVAKWIEDRVGNNYLNKSIVLENVEAVKRIVAEGYGISILLETAVTGEIAAGVLKKIEIDDFNLYVDYFLYHLKGKVLSKATFNFLKLLYNFKALSNIENLGKQFKL